MITRQRQTTSNATNMKYLMSKVRACRVVHRMRAFGKRLMVRLDCAHRAQRSTESAVLNPLSEFSVRSCAGTKTHFNDLAGHA